MSRWKSSPNFHPLLAEAIMDRSGAERAAKIRAKHPDVRIFSPSGLIDPPRIRLLRAAHEDEIVHGLEDMLDRLAVRHGF